MAWLGGAFQMGIARTNLGEQINSENHQFRINRMPVTGMRETYIVNQRVEDQQAGEQEDTVDAVLDGEEQPGDGEQRRSEEERVLELLQRLDFGETREPIPVKNKLTKGDDGELLWVVGDPLLGQSRLLGGIGRLTHLLVLAVEDRVLAEGIHAHPDA